MSIRKWLFRKKKDSITTDNQNPLLEYSRPSIDNYHYDAGFRKGHNLPTSCKRDAYDDPTNHRGAEIDENTSLEHDVQYFRNTKLDKSSLDFVYCRDVVVVREVFKKKLYNLIMYARGKMSNIRQLLRIRSRIGKKSVHPLPELNPMTEREQNNYLNKLYYRMRRLQKDCLTRYQQSFGEFKQSERPINYTGYAGRSVKRSIVQAVPHKEYGTHTTEMNLKGIYLRRQDYTQSPSSLGRKQIPLVSVSQSSSSSSLDPTTAQRDVNIHSSRMIVGTNRRHIL